MGIKIEYNNNCNNCNEKNILSTLKKNKSMYYRKPLNKPHHTIIDFYNVYCSLIKFNKYKTFSRVSWELTMNFIMKNNKSAMVYIVSKPIFEINDDDIQRMLKIHCGAFVYMIVEDLNTTKGLNRERDDFVCIYLQKTLQEYGIDSVIVTNDRYLNYTDIIKDIKSLSIQVFNKDGVNYYPFPAHFLEKVKEWLYDFTPIKSKFYY